MGVDTTQARDAVGEATLELFAESGGYNGLLWRRLKALAPPRGRVLEVGCGIGNITRLILAEPDVDAVHSIDIDPAYVQRVLEDIDDGRLGASASSVEDFLPPGHEAATSETYDTIVCSNVLEHIEDDRGAMGNFHRLLRPGGVALILVPAHPRLFCDLDRNLSHFRRYTPLAFEEVAKAAGLMITRMRHFNPLGVLGWWLNGKVLRRSVLPTGQMRFYSRFAVPVSDWLDRLSPFPVGISLLAACRKSSG